MLEKFKRTIETLENLKTPFSYFVLSFLFITVLRSFLEYFSDNDMAMGGVSMDLSILIHYIVSYIALALIIILIFYLATKTDILKISKVILSGFVVLVSVPIIDLVISGGRGYDVAYVFVRDYHHLLLKYLTFFGEFAFGSGATPGIRTEVAFVLIGSFLYFWLKKNDFVRSLFFILLVYTAIFIYGTLPFFIERILGLFGVEYIYTPILMTNFFLVVLFLAGVPLLYFTNKKYFKVFVKDIRPSRILYFVGMFFLGIVLARGVPGYNFVLTADNIFLFLFVPISIVFAGLFSIVTNNLEDYEIDKISNPDRPLVKKEIDIDLYKKFEWFFLGASLIYSFAAGFLSFFIITLWIGNYFLYSMPPFRLKRIPFLSKLPIAFNSAILIILGFVSITGVSVSDVPKLSILLFLVVFTFVINFIDIKDYEGDKQAEIKTLPVLLGLKRSKRIISIFFAVAYLLVCFLAKEWITLVFFFVLGSLQVYFINRKNYNEKYIFVVVLLSVLYLIIKPLLF